VKNFHFTILSIVLFIYTAIGQESKLYDFPIRGLCIATPVSGNLDSFIVFIREELKPRNINTLILRIDYRYQFKSHPELIDTLALSEAEVKKIVLEAKKDGIQLIPQINLLGHQSWANKPGKLLSVYKEFDETPWLQMPALYSWPNSDSLYCKSYCPLHPELHKIIFDIIDEICDVFECKAFHAGMDEVFILGDDKCPRCSGKSKADLFAGEVKTIHDHLAQNGRKLWIWGDRLIDGRLTGVGMWEGSFNDTYTAIDNIPKDVIICDWHYDSAEKTAITFANKGFKVVTCPWRKPDVAQTQVSDLLQLRKTSKAKIKRNYLGIIETVWSPVSSFFNGYYGKQDLTIPVNYSQSDSVNTAWNTFKTIFIK
jgi:hypothetical protein